MLADVKNWGKSDEKSASNHNKIKFSFRLDKYNTQEKSMLKNDTE